MLYYGFGEQARHEHMSDEYKHRSLVLQTIYENTLSPHTELNKRVVRSNTTNDLPNTHRRSTAETAMNPIGQTFPVIHIHLGGNSEHTVWRSISGAAVLCGNSSVAWFSRTHRRSVLLF